MRRSVFLSFLLLGTTGWLLNAAPAATAPGSFRISARLIAATNTAVAEDDAELADVLPLLQDNLKFNSFRLICRRNFVAMEGLRVKLEQGFSLLLSQIKGETGTIQVERRGKVLLSTRLRIEPGRPVVLGGFPDENGSTLILVLGSE